MNIRDTLTYTKIEGNKTELHIRVYALSTCGFCERALAWLKEASYQHEYLFIDTIELETKRALKAELKATYGDLSVFPVLIINHTNCISGFTEEKYKEAFTNV